MTSAKPLGRSSREEFRRRRLFALMYATQQKDPEGITLKRQRANAHFGVVVLPDPAAEPTRIVPTKETDTEFVCVLMDHRDPFGRVQAEAGEYPVFTVEDDLRGLDDRKRCGVASTEQIVKHNSLGKRDKRVMFARAISQFTQSCVDILAPLIRPECVRSEAHSVDLAGKPALFNVQIRDAKGQDHGQSGGMDHVAPEASASESLWKPFRQGDHKNEAPGRCKDKSVMPDSCVENHLAHQEKTANDQGELAK